MLRRRDKRVFQERQQTNLDEASSNFKILCKKWIVQKTGFFGTMQCPSMTTDMFLLSR